MCSELNDFIAAVFVYICINHERERKEGCPVLKEEKKSGASGTKATHLSPGSAKIIAGSGHKRPTANIRSQK